MRLVRGSFIGSASESVIKYIAPVRKTEGSTSLVVRLLGVLCKGGHGMHNQFENSYEK